MSRFTEPLQLTPHGALNGELLWRTTRELRYEIGCEGSGLVIVVPSNFPTDLASVPRFLWWVIAPHDPRHAAAVVLHDYLCRWIGFSRTTADAILYEALRVLGVSRWRASVMYSAVSIWRVVQSLRLTD